MGVLTDIMGGGGGAIGKVVSAVKDRKKSKSSGSSGGSTGMSNAYSGSMEYDQYHRGGKVRKTGLARLKKGERVLTKGQQRKLGVLRGAKRR